TGTPSRRSPTATFNAAPPTSSRMPVASLISSISASPMTTAPVLSVLTPRDYRGASPFRGAHTVASAPLKRLSATRERPESEDQQPSGGAYGRIRTPKRTTCDPRTPDARPHDEGPGPPK